MINKVTALIALIALMTLNIWLCIYMWIGWNVDYSESQGRIKNWFDDPFRRAQDKYNGWYLSSLLYFFHLSLSLSLSLSLIHTRTLIHYVYVYVYVYIQVLEIY